jgi:drug/metabolite transporter (DMT)-like permease
MSGARVRLGSKRARIGFHKSSEQVIGSGLVALGSIQFGGVVVLGKVAARLGLSVPSILAVRFASAGVLLLPVVLVLGYPPRALARVDWNLLFLGTVLGTSAALALAALQHGSVAAVTLLVFTYPAWLTLLTMLFGNAPPRWIILGALAATLGGAALIALSAGGVKIGPIGIALALGSSAAAALFYFGAAAVVKRSSSLIGSIFVSVGAALSLGLVAILLPTTAWPTSGPHWGLLVGMGALTSGGIVCTFAGMRRLGVVRTAIIATSEPLAASLVAFVLLGETIQLGTAIGGFLILIGAVTAAVSHMPSPADHPVP